METKTIPLSRGAVAIISAEDYERVSRFKWHLTSHGYACRGGGYGKVYLHRMINNTPPGMMTDHSDGDKLNNVRSNLRTANDFENGANQKKRMKTSSKFKGVCLVPGRGKNASLIKWVAYVSHENERFHIGHFKTELDAALAYNIEAKRLFGEFAKLNDLPLDVIAKGIPEKFVQERKTSRFFGVYWNKALNYWVARVKSARVTYHKTELEAAAAYNAAALALHGATAKLNSI